MKKRLISLLLAFSMMLTFLPAGAVSAFAEGNLGSYDCGETPGTVTATLSPNSDGEDTYTLTITGNGPMANYDRYITSSDNSYAPWYEKIQNITRLIVEGGVTTLGDNILYYSYSDSNNDFHSFHPNLREVKLPEGLSCIGASAFCDSPELTEVKIPSTVTKIKDSAFSRCTGLTKIELPPQLEEVGYSSFYGCSGLTEITIPSSVKTIRSGAFEECYNLESVTLSEGIREIGTEAFKRTNLKSLNIPKSVKKLGHDIVYNCWHLPYITIEAPSQLEETFDGSQGVFQPECNTNVYCEPRLVRLLHHFDGNEGFITTVDVTLVDGDKSEPKKIDYGAKIAALGTPTKQGYIFTGWYTDAACKNRYPDAQLFTNINRITLYAGWKFDPKALDFHPLTVTGGTVTVKYDGSDVTSKLNSNTDPTTGKKTYSVPDGAEVTVTLDKTQTPEGMVFDSWSTGNLSLPTSQDYKAESIPFTMNSDVDIAAQYRDAATDHTPDTAVCHQLTVTGGTATVEKDGQPLVIDPVVTGDKKTYSVPDGATVTVTLDKTPIPEDMVFDSWSTGKFSLPLGQDYKAETITFPMSSDANIAAQYRDATIEDDGPGVLGTAAIIGTAAVGTAVLGYQAYSLGAEFAGKLMALPYFPSNRSALAMMLWEDAGKPMPESELLYPDVGQEEQDMDLQHAARWAMENELIPDLNDEGTAPEEMKFFPANPVSKLDVLNAWQKAQELKNN